MPLKKTAVFGLSAGKMYIYTAKVVFVIAAPPADGAGARRSNTKELLYIYSPRIGRKPNREYTQSLIYTICTRSISSRVCVLVLRVPTTYIVNVYLFILYQVGIAQIGRVNTRSSVRTPRPGYPLGNTSPSRAPRCEWAMCRVRPKKERTVCELEFLA